jgi:hypothetical protein
MGASYQSQMRDQNADCTTGPNKDSWWCKAVIDILVVGKFFEKDVL